MTTNHQGMMLARTDMQLAFEPNSFQEAAHLASILIQSGLIPDSIRTKEAVLVILMTGRELGFSAMQSLRSIHCIKGKPTLAASAKVALAKRSPECEYFNLLESTEKLATYETKRKGEKPTKMSFTWEDAVMSGKVSTNPTYKTSPKAMLRARASSALVDAVYPDVVMGIIGSEDIEDDEPTEKRSATILEGEVVPRPVAAAYTAARAEARAEPQITTPIGASILSGFLTAIESAASTDELKVTSAEIKRAVDAGTISNVERLTAQGAYTEKMAKLRKAAPKAEAKPEPKPEPMPEPARAEIDPSEQPDSPPPDDYTNEALERQ